MEICQKEQRIKTNISVSNVPCRLQCNSNITGEFEKNTELKRDIYYEILQYIV